MSDVIRNAIIKLAIELSAPNVQLPDLSPAINQQNALADAMRRTNELAAAAQASSAQGSSAISPSSPASPANTTASIEGARELTAAMSQLEAALRSTAQASAATQSTQREAGESTRTYGTLAEKAAIALADLAVAEERLNAARANVDAVRAANTGDSPEELQARIDAANQWEAALQNRDEAAEASANATIKLSRAELAGQSASNQFAISLAGVGKGLAFMAAGNSEALNKALPLLFTVQGMYDVAKNAAQASRALAAAQLALATAEGVAATTTNVLTAAMAALETSLAPVLPWLALLAGAAWALQYAYNALTAATKAKAEAQADAKAMDEGAALAMEYLNERAKISTDTLMEKISYLDTATEKEAAYRAVLAQRAEAEERVAQVHKNIARGNVGDNAAAGQLEGALGALERQKAAAEKLIDVSKQDAEEKQKANKSLIETVKHRQQELDKAKEILKTETEKDAKLRASIGALKGGERSRLERATSSAEAGTLTRKQAEDLKKYGGEAGQEIANKFFAQFDQGIGTRLEKLIGDPLKKAQDEFEKRQKSVNEKTGGKLAADYVKELEDANEQIMKAAKDLQTELGGTLRALADQIGELKKEISLYKQSAAVARATTAK